MLSDTRAAALALAGRGLGDVRHYAGPAATGGTFGVVAVERGNPQYDAPTGRPFNEWPAEFALTVHAPTADECVAATDSAMDAMFLPRAAAPGLALSDITVVEFTGVEDSGDGGWVCDVVVQLTVRRLPS